jgi:ligand-binding SRPBCC domain-containing protein
MEKLLPLFRRGLGGTLGGGSQWMSWIHIEDLAGLFDGTLMDERYSGPVNGTAPQPVTNREFTSTLARAVERPALLPAPAPAIRLAVGGMGQAVLSSQRVLPAKAQSAGFAFRFPTLEQALSDLIPPGRDGRLRVRQWIPASLEQVFDFFSDARNLERITPPFLHFHITAMSTPEIGVGTLIDYKLRIRGVPVKWRTLIESWKPRTEFVDTQLRGPYRKWHHTHRFEPMAGGILIEDDVLYRLPMGWLGELAGGALVDRDVRRIFDYRKQVIAGIFSPASQGEGA